MKITIEGDGPGEGVTEEVVRTMLDDVLTELGFYDPVKIGVHR